MPIISVEENRGIYYWIRILLHMLFFWTPIESPPRYRARYRARPKTVPQLMKVIRDHWTHPEIAGLRGAVHVLTRAYGEKVRDHLVPAVRLGIITKQFQVLDHVSRNISLYITNCSDDEALRVFERTSVSFIQTESKWERDVTIKAWLLTFLVLVPTVLAGASCLIVLVEDWFGFKTFDWILDIRSFFGTYFLFEILVGAGVVTIHLRALMVRALYKRLWVPRKPRLALIRRNTG